MAFTSYARARRDPRVRKRISEWRFRKQVSIEVVKTPTWARRKPGTRVAGRSDWEVDIPAAITAAFVPT